MGALLLFELDHDAPGKDEIIDAVVDWYRVEYALLSACETVTKDKKGKRLVEPWTCGGRGVGEDAAGKKVPIGSNPTWSKFLAAAAGERLPAKIDQYDLGAHCLAHCGAEIQSRILEPPVTLPPMWRAYHVRRWGDEPDAQFICWFDGDPWKDATLMAGQNNIGRWALKNRDEELLRTYLGSGSGEPTLSIDTPAAELNERGALIIPGRGAV